MGPTPQVQVLGYSQHLSSSGTSTHWDTNPTTSFSIYTSFSASRTLTGTSTTRMSQRPPHTCRGPREAPRGAEPGPGSTAMVSVGARRGAGNAEGPLLRSPHGAGAVGVSSEHADWREKQMHSVHLALQPFSALCINLKICPQSEKHRVGTAMSQAQGAAGPGCVSGCSGNPPRDAARA